MTRPPIPTDPELLHDDLAAVLSEWPTRGFDQQWLADTWAPPTHRTVTTWINPTVTRKGQAVGKFWGLGWSTPEAGAYIGPETELVLWHGTRTDLLGARSAALRALKHRDVERASFLHVRAVDLHWHTVAQAHGETFDVFRIRLDPRAGATPRPAPCLTGCPRCP